MTGLAVARAWLVVSLGRPCRPQVSLATYNQNNQLTQWGSANPTYDQNGNVQSDGLNSYSWNSRNQLASMNLGADLFAYDSVGRRIGKSIGGVTTNFLYDGANVVQELRSGAVMANLLTGGIDELFQRSDSSGVSIFLADALGSTIALTNSSGDVATQYTYDPFGGTIATGAASANTNDYSGRELDETGLYFYRARYYDSSIARFLSEDPVRFLATTNLYDYVRDDPIIFKDPTGNDADIWQLVWP